MDESPRHTAGSQRLWGDIPFPIRTGTHSPASSCVNLCGVLPTWLQTYSACDRGSHCHCFVRRRDPSAASVTTDGHHHRRDANRSHPLRCRLPCHRPMDSGRRPSRTIYGKRYHKRLHSNNRWQTLWLASMAKCTFFPLSMKKIFQFDLFFSKAVVMYLH